MANIGSLTVDLALESANFINGLKQASAATTKAASSISSAMSFAKAGVVGFLGALSIDALSAQIQKAFDYGDAIVDLSNQTGVSTKMLQEFRYAAQVSGSSLESADAAASKFAKNLGSAQLGNKAMIKTFADLGVTSKNADVALRQTMDGISKLGNEAQRNAKTVEIFGKSAGDLAPLLGDGTKGFDALATAAQNYGIVLDDQVLRNGGKVNDQLDTMKMILNAQMANMIIQNADALMQLANGFMQAGAAAVDFFSKMNVNRDMSLQSNNPFDWDIPSIVAGRLSGNSTEDTRNEARTRLKRTADGRRALYTQITEDYNRKIKAGRSPKDQDMVWQRAEAEQMRDMHRAAQSGLAVPMGGVNAGNLPRPTASGGKSRSPHLKLKSDEELYREWDEALMSGRNGLYRSQENLTTNPAERARLQSTQRTNDLNISLSRIDDQTGSDKEVREGKKRYTELQADILKQLEADVAGYDQERILRDRDEAIARQSLDIREAGLRNDLDDLSAQQSLARSTKERRDLALKMVANQFEQERLQLEAIKASKDATDAERAIAEARLRMLPKLEAQAKEQAKKQNQSPLEAYLDAIPRTGAEINDALEGVEVEGLQKVQDGLLGLIKGTETLGDVFKDVTNTILDGLLKIALQQLIIKPLGNLLFGGSDSGGDGGILGSVLKGVLGGIKGARANGGLTSPGDYLVGERGAEVVRIGSPANVIPGHRFKDAANDNAGSINVTFGSIVSNDPDAIKRAAMEGISQMMPIISQQASDKTFTKLKRRGL